MNYLFSKLKLVAGVLALSFFVTVSLSSCGTGNSSSDDSEAVETVEGAEHPAADENVMDSTKMEDEHPSDGSKEEGDEHPTDQ